MSTTVDRLSGITDGVAIKAPCRVSTTANITLSALQTVDGVLVVAADRVLVKNQATTSENGVYAASTGPWTRSTDFDGNRDIVQGTIIAVTAGTANANTFWQVTTAAPAPGSALAFAQYALATPGTVPDGTITPIKLSTGGPSWVASGNLTPLGGVYEKRVTAIASGTTVNLSTIAGNSVHITGVTTITAITLLDGQRVIVTFDGILTLTNGAALVLPGAANLTTAAGMIAEFVGDAGSVTRMVAYSRQASAITTAGLTQATARLIGRTTAGTGAPEEITVGTGLSLTAGALTATASGGITTIASGNLTGTSVAIISIPATYSYLILQITGASINADTRKVMVQVSSNNGASYDSTTANYIYWGVIVGLTSFDVLQASLTEQYTNQNNVDTLDTAIKIHGYHGGTNPSFTFRTKSTAEARQVHGFGTYIGGTAAINALQIAISGSGSFDAGTYALYGVS